MSDMFHNCPISFIMPVVDDEVLVPADRTGAARGDSLLADARLSGGERGAASLKCVMI